MGDSKAGPTERMERWIVRRAPLVLLVTRGVALASLAQIVDLRSGAPLLRLDPSVDGMLAEGDPDRAYYEAFKERFSTGEVILLALAADDVFTFDNLTRIRAISEEIENLDQVDRVASLPFSLNIRSEDDALLTEPF